MCEKAEIPNDDLNSKLKSGYSQYRVEGASPTQDSFSGIPRRRFSVVVASKEVVNT
jgi:hypothetical protein